MDGTAPRAYQYVFNVGLAASQMLSAVLGGDPDESICSRAGRAKLAGKYIGHVAVYFLDRLMGMGHCVNSIEPDESDKEIWSWAE
jgi:hypothetical protein